MALKTDNMNHILVKVISKTTLISEEEKADIENNFPIKTYEKEVLLMHEGHIAKKRILCYYWMYSRI